MKKLLLSFMVLLAMNIMAQSTHTIDFEPAGIGSGWTWVTDQNGSNPALEFVANPDASGINTTANVAKFTALQAGFNWALTYTDDDGEFTFDATNSTVSIMVYKPVISVVAVKFEGLSGSIELQQTNTVTNQWETLTFDFSGQIGNTYSRIVVIPDFVMPYVTGNDRTQDNVVYFDNLMVPDGVVGGPDPEPTVAAPTPTNDPGDVISMFSDAYTDVSVDTWLTVWSSGFLEDITVAGNPTKKYTSLNYAGIETTGANLIDVTGMTHIHIDIWSPDNNDFKIKLVDFGADGAYAGGDDTEHELVFAAPVSEEWISYDIPLTDFTNLNITGNMAQYILSKPANGTLYIDNMFFYYSPVVDPEPLVAAPTPTNAPEDVISIYSDAFTDISGVDYNPAWGQSTVVSYEVIEGDNILKYATLNYQGTDWNGNPQDVSGFEYLHVDFWTANSTDLGIYMVSNVWPSNVEFEYVFTVQTEQWVSVDIPLSYFSGGGVDLADARQFKVEGDGTVWFDNMYFWKEPAPAAMTYWTGEIDNNWHDPINWTDGVPGATTDVVIPTELANYPTISSAAECDDITLQSDASGTATILDNGNLTVNGTASVGRYVTANAWHFLSSPVSDLNVEDIFNSYVDDVYVQNFDEGTNSFADMPFGTMNDMEGYAIWIDNNNYEVVFSNPGFTFNTGSFGSVGNLSRSVPGDDGGNNLLGNPYPSGLDWDVVKLTNTNTMDAYYVEDNGGWATYVSGVGIGTNGVIAPGQGFFVFVSDDGSTSGTVTMDNNARVHTSTPFLKNTVANLVRLQVAGNDNMDETVVRFSNEATANFDESFDAFKFFASNEMIPQIYSVSNKNMAINTLPEVDEVQLGFVAHVDGEYTISAIEINDIAEVWLEDTFTGIIANLTDDSYTFNYVAGENSERFVLHFASLSVADNMADNVSIFSADENIFVNFPNEVEGQLTVFNVMGQEILSSKISESSNVVTINQTGFFVVKVTVDGQQFSKKVLLK